MAPSKRSAQTTKPAADDSSAEIEIVKVNSEHSAPLEETPQSPATVTVTANQQKQKQKRKKRQPTLPHQRRMVQALGRIEGRIVPVGNGIRIETEDGSQFRVSSLKDTKLSLRLLSLSDAQRVGRFAFWPAFQKEGITLISFNNAEEWTPPQNSPPVDRMFVCGTLQALESERFSVLIGYGHNRDRTRYDRLLLVESAPQPDWTVGQWVDVVLQREGEAWRWRGEFHPRGPQVGSHFKSWLPYLEAAEESEPDEQAEQSA